MTGLNRIISTAGKFIFPSLLWNVAVKEKIIYLTFDDGPIPEVTPWVLSLLKNYNAKATFYCIGENVSKHSDIFKQVLADGHRIGNHTFNHVNGWKTSTNDYIENILLAEKAIRENLPQPKTYNLQPTTTSPQPTTYNSQLITENRKLFRPPYGKITPGQIKKLKELNYRIVMWDVLSEDYDKNKKPLDCFEEVIKHSKPGSIIVFHDSLKAWGNLEKVLPEVLKYYSERGYEFKAL